MPTKPLDKTDKAILNLLQEDGRLTNSKIAAALSLSESPCWRRLKRLEEEGFISDYQANLDRRKLNLGVVAFVQLTVSEHDEASTARFEQIILASEHVMACHNTTGEADFLLQVMAEDLDAYSRFVENTLRRLPGISAIRSSLSLREIKHSTRLPLTD